jgi:hypothetical protein
MASAAVVLATLAVPVGYVAITGAAFLAAVRFRGSNRTDAILAAVVSGIAWTAFCVYALLFADSYSRLSALLIVLLPAIWLAWTSWRGAFPFPPAGRAVSSAPPVPLLDRAAVAAAGLLILFAFLDASTSPITAWDADVSWDKWAADWARRTNSYGYRVGAYPQLLPMFSSVLYKLTGAFQHPIPLEQYVLHAMHPLFGVILLVSVVRLCHVLGLPAWPSLLVTFGNRELQNQLTSGAADLLLAAMTAASTALFVTYQKGAWTSRFGMAAVVGPALFAVGFTKANGLPWVLLPLSYLAVHHTTKTDDGRPASLRPAGLLATVLLPVVLCLPFFVHQFAAPRPAPPAPDEARAREVNYSATSLLSTLAKISSDASAGQGFAGRVGGAAGTILDSFVIPAVVQPVVGVLIVALLALSVRRPPGAALLIPLAGTLVVWYHLAAYDARNILHMLPIAGVLATMGAAEARTIGWWRFLRVPVALAAAAFIALASVNVVKGILRPLLLFRPDGERQTLIGRRLMAMDRGLEERVRLHFPAEYPVYSLLTRLPVTSGANHLLATAHLYRWFPRGAYPLADWTIGWGGDGDLWIGMRPTLPRFYDAWTMLHETPFFRVWIVERDLRSIPLSELTITGASPPLVKAASPSALEVELTGEDGVVAYNLRDRDLKRGSFVIWRAFVEGGARDPAIGSGFVTYDPGIVDLERTTTAVDVERAGEGIIAYSGLITFAGPVSRDLSNRILAGIVGTAGGRTLRVRAFEVSVHP